MPFYCIYIIYNQCFIFFLHIEHLFNPHLVQSFPVVHTRRINEIQNAVMNPHILSEGISAEVHHGGGRSGFQVDAFQGIDAIVDKEGVELLSGLVDQHFPLPAAVGFHFAVPFAVFVEGEGVTLQLVAGRIEDNRFVVDVGEDVELVVDGINRGINGLDEFGLDFVMAIVPPDATSSFVVLDVMEQFRFFVMAIEVSVIAQSRVEKMALSGDEDAVASGHDGGELVIKFIP